MISNVYKVRDMGRFMMDHGDAGEQEIGDVFYKRAVFLADYKDFNAVCSWLLKTVGARPRATPRAFARRHWDSL